MGGLTEEFEQFLDQVSKTVPNKEQQRKITTAGGKAYQQVVTDITKSKHYSSHRDAKFGHMADHIAFSDKNIDGDIDGSATVGWDNKFHDMNAMRLNNGTIHIKADHFVDLARQQANEAVLKAESEEYKKIIGGK